MFHCHALLVFFGLFFNKYFPLAFFFLGVEEDNFQLFFQLEIFLGIFCGFLLNFFSFFIFFSYFVFKGLFSSFFSI